MKSIKRRSFLKSTAAAAVLGVAPFNILKAGESPNKKLNVAVIGVGGQGGSNARSLSSTENIIALCDCHESWHKKRIKGYKVLQKVPLYKDYRVMFDKIGKEIDAVCIATPEHSHYAISMYAMQRGKHVYCQKPLCHTVNEVRLLTEASKKLKVITQMGHQGHSSPSSSNIREWVQAGAIGPVKEVIAYSKKNYWTDKPLVKGSKIPADLDWDLYLNRAGEIPFSSSYMNREWIRYSHFSGAVGDMGAHILDPAYYSLDLRIPLSVHAEVPIPAMKGSLPRGGIITWEFAARGDMPPVTMKYYLGVGIDYPKPKHMGKMRSGIMNSGSALIGEKGTILAGSHSQGGMIIPEPLRKEVGKPSGKSYRSKGRDHFRNWTMAIKGEDKAMSSFDYSGPLSEIIVLGDLALLHPGKKLLWDSEKMKITNDEAANKSLFMRRLDPRDDKGWI